MTHDKDELGIAAVTDETEQMSDEEAVEAAEIRAEIEETRIEMGGTLNELGDRLDPGHLLNEAKENVRDATIGRVEETARGISDMVMDTIKRNPIPAAMAGAGLALLWANRSNGNAQRYSGEYRTTGYYYGGHDQRRGIGDRAGDTVSSVGETVTDAAERVGQAVGRAGENIGQAAGEVSQNAGQTVGQIGSQFDRLMQASPFAMVAVAAGAGAVVGALVPETPQEREVMGDASRQVGTVVRDAVEEVSTRADVSAEEALVQAEAEIRARS